MRKLAAIEALVSASIICTDTSVPDKGFNYINGTITCSANSKSAVNDVPVRTTSLMTSVLEHQLEPSRRRGWQLAVETQGK